jgi:2-methylcitrate dehydratase PrpD
MARAATASNIGTSEPLGEHDDRCRRLASGPARCRTGYADLPASAVESARHDILDTFGCMLGGSGSPGIDEFFAVISRWGGLAESRVLLRGIRLPAPQAALLNASMGHALDFDDTPDTGLNPSRRLRVGLGTGGLR